MDDYDRAQRGNNRERREEKRDEMREEMRDEMRESDLLREDRE